MKDKLIKAILEAADYIGSCVDVGSGRCRISNYFDNATDLAYIVGDPDFDDPGQSTEISKDEFMSVLGNPDVVDRYISKNCYYFYVSKAGNIPIDKAKLFFIYDNDSDIHYFFEKTK